MAISERLKQLIGNRKQKDFADEMGVTPTRINQYLNERQEPASDFLRKLASKGVNINWFLTGEGVAYEKQSGSAELPVEVQSLINEIMKTPDLAVTIARELRAILINLAQAEHARKMMKLSNDEIKKVLKSKK